MGEAADSQRRPQESAAESEQRSVWSQQAKQKVFYPCAAVQKRRLERSGGVAAGGALVAAQSTAEEEAGGSC